MTESCDSMLEQATKALKDYFGHADFRANQRELIEQVLDDRDVLAVMPTGAGKSLVYQVPAIVSEGLAIVVSPLISLMKDQVNALTQAGVRAAFLNSSISPAEQAEVLEYAASGSCKLLYVAPERLDAPRFLSLCKTTKISLVAVDEAHCVSQWGQDFRPSYLGIAAFIGSLPNRPPVCALTATATPEVQKDIAHALGLIDPFSLVSGFDRPNLYFGVERPDPKAKRACLLRLVRERSGQAGIVYCSTRQAVEDVCDLLCEGGFEATRYHAGLSAAERHANQEDFLFDRKPLMVATNAFGMGIDKSNVSFVIHYNMPSDVESYYQEAGRAGRDGSPADCILIYNKKDVQTCQFLIDKGYEQRQSEGDEERSHTLYERDCERLRQMVFYSTSTDCLRSFILRYFGQTEAPFRCEHCSNCSTDYAVEDVTVEAQKILSCVLRLGQRNRQAGKALIVDILRGSKAEKIFAQGYDSLTTYGIMDEVPSKRIRYVLDALVAEGLLAQTDGSYPVIEATERGAAFLRDRKALEIKVPKRLPKEELPDTGARSRRRSPGSGSADSELFEKLKTVRFELASEAGVPAYIVFSNATLSDMCEKMPASIEELLAVSGVGQVKAERYGSAFLDAIRAHRAG
ncbi:DNA helicase RecQ [Raoultibacter timonensis]|nr:DNA helicase RecQ [Raoultibacter timonensis]